MPSTQGSQNDTAIQRILDHSAQGVALRDAFFKDKAPQVAEIARAQAVALARGNKLLFAGNGGSAADAQHLAAEYVNRFKLERPPLPGIALTTDTSVLTAIGNDYGFDQVFVKQVQALGNPGDIFVAISTSGGSTNIIQAMRAAREKQLTILGLSGGTGGDMPTLCDYSLVVPSPVTALVQEIHITVGHLLCELTDYYLFEAVHELAPYLNHIED